jgi:sugar lactone lactonase YvrE
MMSFDLKQIEAVAGAFLLTATLSVNGAAIQTSGPTNSNFIVSTLVPDGILMQPSDVAIGADGDLYIADAGHFVLRKVDRQGHVSIVAGVLDRNEKYDRKPSVPLQQRALGQCYSTTGNGCAPTEAIFSGPRHITIDNKGLLYVSDGFASKIRIVDLKENKVSAYVGDHGGWSDLLLRHPQGVAIDSNGALYIADSGNNAIRKVAQAGHLAAEGELEHGGRWRNGKLETVAGTGPDLAVCSDTAGDAKTLPLLGPEGIAFDKRDNLYIVDTGCGLVKQVSPSGVVKTIIGSGVRPDASGALIPFNGPNLQARQINLRWPVAVAADPQGNLYIADAGFNVIWFYDATSQQVSLFAGLAPNGKVCAKHTSINGDGCHPDGAFLNVPYALALDADGTIYVAESGGLASPVGPFIIRKFTPMK